LPFVTDPFNLRRGAHGIEYFDRQGRTAYRRRLGCRVIYLPVISYPTLHSTLNKVQMTMTFP
jgi:hypothetical protein